MTSQRTTAAIQTFGLPGGAVLPESVGVDPATGDAYVGSLAEGALYRLTSAGEVDTWSPARADGRSSVAGVKVDTDGRLWAAGGYEGTVHVYELASRSLLARLDVGARPSCVNDIAFGPSGEAYVTDSLISLLFRVEEEPVSIEPWIDLAEQGVPWSEGLNLTSAAPVRAVARVLAATAAVLVVIAAKATAAPLANGGRVRSGCDLTIPIRADGGAGRIAVRFRGIQADDFAFAANGDLYLTENPLSRLICITPMGTVTNSVRARTAWTTPPRSGSTHARTTANACMSPTPRTSAPIRACRK